MASATIGRVRLGDYVTIRTGKLDANASSVDGTYPFFTCSKTPLRIATYSYDCECTLVAGNGDLNVKYYNGKFDAYQRTYIIEAIDKQAIDVRYLYHFLDVYVEVLRTQSIGGVIKYIKLGNLTEAPIPLPSLAEQRRIAAVLDKISEMKRNAEARLQKLDLLVKARFNEMFGDPSINPKGWAIGKVADVAEYWNGLTYKPENVSDKGTIVLRSSNIQSGALSFHDVVRVSLNAKEKNCVRSGDILMCSRNGSAALVGKTAIIPELNEKMYFGAFMMVLRSEQPRYLNSFFGSKAFRQQIACGKTTTVNQITCSMIDKVRLPLPPGSLQTSFSSYVAKVEAQKATAQKELEKVDLLYRAKLQEYFG